MKKNVLLILLLISASWMLKAQSYSGGSGTEGNPFQIANKTDLKYLSENYTHYDGYYFIQTADIYFLASDFQSSGDFYYGGAGFLPIGAGIGTTNIRFKSSYDGNNFIIDGIYMNRSEDDVGFFGEVAEYRMSVSPWTVLHTPTIENVTLTNVNITNTGALTGGLVGQFFDGTISNCSVSGSVTGIQAGGITGQNEFSGTIEKSRSNVSVTGTFQVGGLIGWAVGNVSCCYSSGDVTGNSSTGGFVGVVGEDVTISNSYSTGNVVRATSSTNSYFGGFCGYVSGGGMAGGPGTIQNCYSIGDVTYTGASDPTDKGFCGQSDGGTFTDNFFDSEASNQTAANGATAKNTTQMKTQSTFTNWDFSTVWEIIGGNGASYPTLRDNPEPSSVVTPTTQALNIVFSSVQTTQMTVSWTNGNGANRVVFAKQANTGTTSPVDNTTYTANTSFGSGTEITTGWYCVYNGNGSSVSVSNLTQGTDYIFQVFEYNGGAGEELYLTSTTTNNPKAQTTIGTPTTQSSNILFSDVQTTQMTVSWTDGNGANRVVFAKQANTGTTSPVGNTTYTANTSFGSGTEIATGWYCVYNGSGSSVSVTNLTAESDYIFQVCEYNGGSGEELYLSTTTSDNPKSQATTAPPSEPTTQAIDIVFSDVQSNQMTVAWTDGNGSSRVVFAKQATTGTTAPVDNATYAASTSFGSGTEIATGWYCVYNGSGSSVTVSGLTVNTTYIFQVFEYNGGSGEENYLITTATNNPKPRLTLSSDKTSYTYTGTTETWIVPAGVTEVLVKAWGAGGAGSTYGATPPAGADGGGSGGYATATLTVTPGQELIIAVGGGGKHGIRDIAGGLGGWPGGGYGTKGDGAGGGGGGYSGVFLSSLDQANALIIAGAGGGGTGFRVGGAGGGTTGNRGGTDGGYGGTQSAGGSGTTYGADGSALQGGNGDTRGQIDDLSYDGGGGGGGYYGGEGGYSDAKGAGGGSGFLHPTLANGSFITGQDGQPLAGGTAPNNTDEDYIAGVGNGSNGPDDAGNGLIVISYSLPTPPATLTWTGTVDSDWNTAGNWDLNALPVSSTDIIISDVVNDPIVASGANASCYNLTVEAGASLTINSGGSLITNGTITNNGTINIKRNITSGVWHLISNPITSATANIFVGNYLQNWDETSGTWSDIVETSTSLTPVKGYSLWTIDGTPTDYTFTGTPNTGNQSTGITANGSGGSYNGANLLGNPYPSSIDWSGLDDTYGAVNYWNGTGYVSWNNGSGSGSQYIPPMQGFFIVTGTAGTFSVGNANRTHTGATNYYKSLTDLSAGLVLFADNGSYRDDLWLLQRENRHAGFDLESDAYKFMSSTPGISQLWSVCPDGNLSIDARPYQETIQLGFANDVAGLYTIGISEIADITSTLLEDTKANLFYDLTKGAYEFAWDVNDDENRFNLHLNVVGLEETPGNESNILIYATNGNIFIKGAEKGEARVSDLMGRIVLQQQINGKEIVSIPANLKTGIYLVMVQQGKEVKTEKIFIR